MIVHIEYKYIVPVFHFIPHLVLMLDMHPLTWLTLVKPTVRSGEQMTNGSSQLWHFVFPIFSKLPRVYYPVFLDVPPKDTILLFKLQGTQAEKQLQVCREKYFVYLTTQPSHTSPLSYLKVFSVVLCED